MPILFIMTWPLQDGIKNFVNYPLGYIEGCLKEICKKHDLKHEKIESEYKEALKNSPIPDFDYYK